MQSSALPSELRTPPLPLVALVGHPEVHRDLGVWASQVLRPPLVAIAVADANESVLARLFGGYQRATHALPWRCPCCRSCRPRALATAARGPAPVDCPCSAYAPAPRARAGLRAAGVKKVPKPFAVPDGILKADWFLKQRQRRAAVALAFVDRCARPRGGWGAGGLGTIGLGPSAAVSPGCCCYSSSRPWCAQRSI